MKNVLKFGVRVEYGKVRYITAHVTRTRFIFLYIHTHVTAYGTRTRFIFFYTHVTAHVTRTRVHFLYLYT